MDEKQIINGLYEYKDEIISLLKSKNWKHFGDYFIIMAKYANGNFDKDFQKVFCRFYILNGARGLTHPQKEIFFKLLSQKEPSLNIILKTLYNVPGYQNSRRLFLSFGTKLLHTTDTNLPIYDGNVAHILGLKKQKNLNTLEEKISNRLDIYDELKSRFNSLSSNDKIQRYLIDIRKDLKKVALSDNFAWQDKLLSDHKLLDSALWALYSIKSY